MTDAGTSVASLDAELKSGAYTGTWTLDPSQSTVALKTKAMWGVVPVKGSFSEMDGTAEVRADGGVTAHLQIQSASINTKMKKRDAHLRSDDFFASDRFPSITVDIERLAATPTGVTADGNLTVRDRTIPLSFPATISNLSAEQVTLDAEVVVDRSDVGLDFRSKGATTMANTLILHAVFARR